MPTHVEADDAPPGLHQCIGHAGPHSARLSGSVDQKHRWVVVGAAHLRLQAYAGKAAILDDAHARSLKRGTSFVEALERIRPLLHGSEACKKPKLWKPARF